MPFKRVIRRTESDRRPSRFIRAVGVQSECRFLRRFAARNLSRSLKLLRRTEPVMRWWRFTRPSAFQSERWNLSACSTRTNSRRALKLMQGSSMSLTCKGPRRDQGRDTTPRPLIKGEKDDCPTRVKCAIDPLRCNALRRAGAVSSFTPSGTSTLAKDKAVAQAGLSRRRPLVFRNCGCPRRRDANSPPYG